MQALAPLTTPKVAGFYDPVTATVSYVVTDPITRLAAIIDPVFDFDAASGKTTTTNADKVIEYVKSNDLVVEWILETHAHADHLTAAPYIKESVGGMVGIGVHIRTVQQAFAGVFNEGSEFKTDGSQFDYLFEPDEMFSIGEMTGRAMHTPGHTPACSTYIINGSAFVGDTIFMPDYGTARCDFPGGDAATLYRSVKKIYQMPTSTRVFTCHDYPPDGREPAWESTVAEQAMKNIHINYNTSEAEFVKMRAARDATLSMPSLILPSIQINMRAGEFPEPESNGTSYLKIPLNKL